MSVDTLKTEHVNMPRFPKRLILVTTKPRQGDCWAVCRCRGARGRRHGPALFEPLEGLTGGGNSVNHQPLGEKNSSSGLFLSFVSVCWMKILLGRDSHNLLLKVKLLGYFWCLFAVLSELSVICFQSGDSIAADQRAGGKQLA